MVCYLVFAGLIGYAVWSYGGVIPNRWSLFLFGLGSLSVFCAVWSPESKTAPPLRRGFRWPLFLLPSYAVLQLIPLPLWILKIVSPLRAESLGALGVILPGVAGGPLSVFPSGTFSHLLRVCAYTVTFLLVRDFAWRFRTVPWGIALPIVAIGTMEALIGLLQLAAGAEVRGTYANRNHYACLLELALPFAVLYPLALVARSRSLRGSAPTAGLKLGAGLAMFLCILLGEFYSFSRMGLVASLCSLLVVASLLITAWPARWWKRIVAACLVAAILVLAFVLLSPGQAFQRFTSLGVGTEGNGDRPQLWRETLRMIPAYPLFGCGLGGYESAFLRFKVSNPMYTDDYAHNDYLQILAEAGVIGFLISAVLIGTALICAVRRSFQHDIASARWLALACTGAITAILIHSAADFNLYVPANALVLSWIVGIAASLRFYA